MVTALTYASFIGTMQDNGVAIFTPWSWGDGMFETVHLFSRYGHANRVQSVSSNDSLVSAYSSISNKGDSLTVIFVNRAEKDAQEVQLKLANFDADLKFKTLTLQNLKGETFVSHTNNALKENAVNASVAGGKTTATAASADMIKMTLPAKSITALLLFSENPKAVDTTEALRHVAMPHAGLRYALVASGKQVAVNGIAPGSRYVLMNAIGQVVARGVWNGPGTSLAIAVPGPGKYMLQVRPGISR